VDTLRHLIPKLIDVSIRRHHHADIVSQLGEFDRQCSDDIGEAARFGQRHDL
jgi:hypothetical protein